MHNIFLLTEGTWGQIITGLTTIILAFIGYLKIKGEVKEVKNTVGVVKENQDKLKENQDTLKVQIDGHMTKLLEQTGAAKKAEGKEEGIEAGIAQQKVIQQDIAAVETAGKIKDLEIKVIAQIADNTKETAENTKKITDDTAKHTGPPKE